MIAHILVVLILLDLMDWSIVKNAIVNFFCNINRCTLSNLGQLVDLNIHAIDHLRVTLKPTCELEIKDTSCLQLVN
jgi:hypothetical protein